MTTFATTMFPSDLSVMETAYEVGRVLDIGWRAAGLLAEEDVEAFQAHLAAQSTLLVGALDSGDIRSALGDVCMCPIRINHDKESPCRWPSEILNRPHQLPLLGS